MSFTKLNEKGKQIRYTKAVIDCSKDEPIVEQSHKAEVDINKIVRKHGTDLIAKVAAMQSRDYQFDDVTGNDFQESMLILTKAQQNFEAMPSQIRKQFDNDPAKFLDFVQDKNNLPQLRKMGLAHPAPAAEPPIEVVLAPAPAPAVAPAAAPAPAAATPNTETP